MVSFLLGVKRKRKLVSHLSGTSLEHWLDSLVVAVVFDREVRR